MESVFAEAELSRQWYFLECRESVRYSATSRVVVKRSMADRRVVGAVGETEERIVPSAVFPLG